LKVLGCDRKCESCPLLELCGGIEQYGVKGYHCSLAGCELKFPALKRMQECSTCRHIKVAWDLKEWEVANLVSEVTNLKAIEARPPELPTVVPTISLKDSTSYDFGLLDVNALVVMFEDLFDEEIRRKVEDAGDIHTYLNFDGKVLASSIMPDDIITQEEVFYFFLDTVDRLKFDAAIAWDSPVYIDIPLYDSWVNLLMGLKLTHELAEWGMPVYGLAKGNLENQIKFSVETLAKVGINSMALHTSEYMMDYKVDSMVRQVLYSYSNRLSESAKSVLLVGVLNPRWLPLIEDTFPRVKHQKLSIAGLSCFLDAERGRIYSASEYVDTTSKYVQCECSACSEIGPLDLMANLGARIRHNLNYMIEQITNPSPAYAQMKKYDLVLQENKKLLLASDFHMWISCGNFYAKETWAVYSWIRYSKSTVKVKILKRFCKTFGLKITAEWISKKMQELFPGVEWGGDLERIRRMLGRKKKRVKALVEGAFEHFGKNELYKGQFIKYFRDRGMGTEEIDKLWVKAHSMRIIKIGARSVIRKKNTLAILGDVMVFILAGKENE